jgi:hypothetical protein
MKKSFVLELLDSHFLFPLFNSFKKVKITAPYTTQPMQLDKTQDQPAESSHSVVYCTQAGVYV